MMTACIIPEKSGISMFKAYVTIFIQLLKFITKKTTHNSKFKTHNYSSSSSFSKIEHNCRPCRKIAHDMYIHKNINKTMLIAP